MRAATERRLLRQLAPLIFALWFAIAVLLALLAGCWTGAYTSPERPPLPRPHHDFACVTLEAGRVPSEPIWSSQCTDTETETEYWVCRSHAYERWADELRAWFEGASMECAP